MLLLYIHFTLQELCSQNGFIHVPQKLTDKRILQCLVRMWDATGCVYIQEHRQWEICKQLSQNSSGMRCACSGSRLALHPSQLQMILNYFKKRQIFLLEEASSRKRGDLAELSSDWLNSWGLADWVTHQCGKLVASQKAVPVTKICIYK